jgi:hypothetical protein
MLSIPHDVVMDLNNVMKPDYESYIKKLVSHGDSPACMVSRRTIFFHVTGRRSINVGTS